MTPWLTSGTTYQRCELPARELRDRAGLDTLVGDRMMFMDDGRIAVGTEEGGFAPDVVVISWWAPEEGNATEMLADARRAGQRIVLDVDDNPWAHRGFANPDWTKLLREVDAVTVTTEALAGQLRRHMARIPVHVLPTMFDPSPYQSPAAGIPAEGAWGARWALEPGEALLCYRGGLQWHSRDVQALRWLRAYPFVHLGHDPRQWHCAKCDRHWGTASLPSFRCPVCDGPLERSRFFVARVDGAQSTTLEELTGVRVARRFRIHSYRNYARLLGLVSPYVTLGVVPLEPGGFSEAKTHIGGLEYAAVGVPWVASATAEYVRLAGHAKSACIVYRPREWEHTVSRLVRDPELRAEVAAVQQERAEAMRPAYWWERWADTLTRVPMKRTHSTDRGPTILASASQPVP